MLPGQPVPKKLSYYFGRHQAGALSCANHPDRANAGNDRGRTRIVLPRRIRLADLRTESKLATGATSPDAILGQSNGL